MGSDTKQKSARNIDGGSSLFRIPNQSDANMVGLERTNQLESFPVSSNCRNSSGENLGRLDGHILQHRST
jgi:hypothetical protein